MGKIVAACAAALCALSLSAAWAQSNEIALQLTPPTWQGNVAQVSVELRNLTARSFAGLPLTCEFVAGGQVLATTRRVVPILAAGESLTVEVLADVNAQPIDAVRCSTETYGR
ncbi:MAG: hypothetical protein JNL66_17900 [Alphaproteobacteria bacterium]|nr:hypothetical protein [Alphaproteobacteria bacterium]